MDAVLARVAINEIIVVLVGVHHPREGELPEVIQAGGSFTLLFHTVQSRH
jgi:hypothetical protein